jgi:hypothetical protein
MDVNIKLSMYLTSRETEPKENTPSAPTEERTDGRRERRDGEEERETRRGRAASEGASDVLTGQIIVRERIKICH